MYSAEFFQSVGVPITDKTTNLFYLTLDQKGEAIEQKVYSIWDLLADIGGFKDGLIMVFGGLFAVFDSKWFSIDLGKAVFRVPLRNVRSQSRKSERSLRHEDIINGDRIIVPNTLVAALQKWKRSTPYKARFFGLFCRCLGSREKRSELAYKKKS